MKRKGNMPTKEMVIMGLTVIAAAAIIAVATRGVDGIVTSIIEKLL
jgi:preprotein translocase subunit SecE